MSTQFESPWFEDSKNGVTWPSLIKIVQIDIVGVHDTLSTNFPSFDPKRSCDPTFGILMSIFKRLANSQNSLHRPNLGKDHDSFILSEVVGIKGKNGENRGKYTKIQCKNCNGFAIFYFYFLIYLFVYIYFNLFIIDS